MAVPTHLYVYYLVEPDDFDILRAAALALQNRVYEATGVRGRLMERIDDRSTWMEVYENVGDLHQFRLAVERARKGEPAWDRLETGRHYECFVE